MEWSDDKLKDLITAYYKQRVFWDLSDRGYKNKRLKPKVWE